MRTIGRISGARCLQLGLAEQHHHRRTHNMETVGAVRLGCYCSGRRACLPSNCAFTFLFLLILQTFKLLQQHRMHLVEKDRSVNTLHATLRCVRCRLLVHDTLKLPLSS